MAPMTAGRNSLQSSASPLRDLVRKRDFYAGGLMILLGLGIALKGIPRDTYRLMSKVTTRPGVDPQDKIDELRIAKRQRSSC